MHRVPLILSFVCSFHYLSPLYCLFSFSFLWWASGWVTAARSGKLEEFFAKLFKLLLVFLCQVPGTWGCGSPSPPPSTTSVHSLFIAPTCNFAITNTKLYPQKALQKDWQHWTVFSCVVRTARAKQWGAKCKIHQGVIGCWGKDSKAIMLGERVTKCLLKSLLMACGYAHQQLWISALHKHLYYKFPKLSSLRRENTIPGVSGKVISVHSFKAQLGHLFFF